MSSRVFTDTPRSEKFIDLVGDLQTDLTNLIKKEIELAKTEMGEKFKTLGRNAGFAAAGGVLALMAVFLLLLGMGAIVAHLFIKAGMSAATAYFVSYMGLALLLAGVGYALVHKAVAGFSKVSLAPEKALGAVKGAEAVPIQIKQVKPKEAKQPSSEELQTQVLNARDRMESEMTELKARLTPGYMAKSFLAGMKHHPITTLLFGAGTGLGGFLYWRSRQHTKVAQIHAARRNWVFKLRRA